MKYVTLDLRCFIPLIEQFVDLNLNLSRMYLTYTDVLTAIVIGNSYGSVFNDSPVFNGLGRMLQGLHHYEVNEDDDKALAEIARDIEHRPEYQMIVNGVRMSLHPLSGGVMLDPSSVNIFYKSMTFKIRL